MANFNSIDWNNYSVKGMSAYFTRTNPIPLDKSDIFSTLEEAEAYASGSPIAYAGQIISVADFVNDKVDVYKLKTDRTLEKIGSNQTQTAENYSAACALATSENIGQIVNVLEEEEGEMEGSAVTFSNGLYIITGVGAASKLGVTSATGDVSADIENLKTRVSALEDVTANLYWETDEDLIIE